MLRVGDFENLGPKDSVVVGLGRMLFGQHFATGLWYGTVQFVVVIVSIRT